MAPACIWCLSCCYKCLTRSNLGRKSYCASWWNAVHCGEQGIVGFIVWEFRTVQQIPIGWLLLLPILFPLGCLPVGWYYTQSEGSSHNLSLCGNNFTDTSGNEFSRGGLIQPSDNEDSPSQCHAWCSSLMSAFPLSQFFLHFYCPSPKSCWTTVKTVC